MFVRFLQMSAMIKPKSVPKDALEGVKRNLPDGDRVAVMYGRNV
jgi:hypothetical protein